MSIVRRLEALQPIEVGIDGPTSGQMARKFRSIRRDPLTYLREVSAQYGDVVSFPVPGAPALLLNDPDDARHVLQGNARNWNKRTVQYGALARVTGQGLLATSEPDWITHRRMAAPAFHKQRLLAVSDQVRRAADDAFAALDAPGRNHDETVDVGALVHRIGLDAVGRALFSADLSGPAQHLLDATSQAAELVVRLGRAIVPTARWTPTRTNLRLWLTRRRFDRITRQLVVSRRARTLPVPGGSTGGDDLLGLLLDSGLDDDAIRDELVTMVIAGHETVAAALTWTLMLLAEHPDAQGKVRAELAELGRPVSMLDDRATIPWTRAVIDEALRLYPPAWVVSRRAVEADVVAGVEVPAGTLAIVSPWLIHRHAGTWTDPTQFQPERFLDPAAGREAYLPFGQGPRLCIGREFALGEMVVVLAHLLRDYRVTVPSGWTRPQPVAQVAVHPRTPMALLVTRLSPARVRA